MKKISKIISHAYLLVASLSGLVWYWFGGGGFDALMYASVHLAAISACDILSRD